VVHRASAAVSLQDRFSGVEQLLTLFHQFPFIHPAKQIRISSERFSGMV
jgi:hypothetical protein